MSELTNLNPFRLGFGLMRLPKLEDGSIDIPQVCEMTDRFIKAGGIYFDTAFVYDGGKSEEAFRKAVAERYPRESYTLATKLHATAGGCHDAESARQEFYTSLERTGAGYIDFYLLHALQRSNVEKYDEYGLWDFVKEQKEKGLIRHWGFSFHADPELLEELLDAHPDAEFVQLQINYADWENPGVASRRNFEICRAHGKPVVIMEPVKGGVLADPIPEVKKILDDSGRGWSYASWALRFAAGVDNLLAVLSGMSNLSQMDDNLKTMDHFEGLSEEDMQVIRKAQEALNNDKSIPCTSCHYYTAGCPMGIPIPEIFNVENRKKGSVRFRTVREYTIVTQGKGKASDCIGCGQCEGVCPQHLPIIELLETCRNLEED
ncbi:MAG: aldo/keto reductase [Clostridia bacterium]|nr:aldo/keto reductase [Clostridia bacterium]